jgi:tripartite-type tricarboxylate transporter receptor subunit TctC
MRRLALAVLTVLCVAGAYAQYPAKPVRVVVAFPPGGASDTAARTIVRHVFDNRVVIDNRPGGHGVNAVQAVWNAAPDGYTLLWGIGSMVALPMIWNDFPTKSMSEFQAVAMAAQLIYGMFVHPGVPAKTPIEFATYARGRNENFASAALSEYLAADRFMKATNITMTRVGYKGGIQALTDLASGRVTAQFAPASPVTPLVRDGRIRILGVLEPTRVTAFPDTPTMSEAGFPTVTVAGWQALFAPPGTPLTVTTVLAQRVIAAHQDASIREKLAQSLIRPRYETALALNKTIADDIKMWRTFITDNHITTD